MNFKIKNVFPVFISESVWSLYVFIYYQVWTIQSLFIYMTQVTCSYIYIIHYLGLSIYVHMLVSRLKSDCDCYFYCTFNTLTT